MNFSKLLKKSEPAQPVLPELGEDGGDFMEMGTPEPVLESLREMARANGMSEEAIQILYAS